MMKKRLLSLLLTVMMSVTLFSGMTAGAADDQAPKITGVTVMVNG